MVSKWGNTAKLYSPKIVQKNETTGIAPQTRHSAKEANCCIHQQIIPVS
jgi:hypothetical protein